MDEWLEEIKMAKARKKAESAIDYSKVNSLSDLKEKIHYHRTDVAQINDYLGGIPEGCILQWPAPQGAGKTTITCQMVISALKYLPNKIKAGIMDFECRMNISMLKYFCKIYGVDESRVLYKKAIDGQDGLEQMRHWVEDDDVLFIIGDSLKCVTDRGNIEKKLTENEAMMANAKLVNSFIHKIFFKVPQNKKTMFWIDHAKKTSTPGSYITWLDSKSGDAIKFQASARIFLKKGKKRYKKTVKGNTKFTGHELVIKVDKSTVCPMVEIKAVPFYYKKGISQYTYILNKCVEYGIIKKSIDDKKNVYVYVDGEKEILIGSGPKVIKNWVNENLDIWENIKDEIYRRGKEIFEQDTYSDVTVYDEEFKIGKASKDDEDE